MSLHSYVKPKPVMKLFRKFPHKNIRMTDVSKIEIEAEKIWWDNIPDLLDPYGKQTKSRKISYLIFSFLELS